MKYFSIVIAVVILLSMTVTCSAKEYSFNIADENFYAEKEISEFITGGIKASRYEENHANID